MCANRSITHILGVRARVGAADMSGAVLICCQLAAMAFDFNSHAAAASFLPCARRQVE